MDRQLSVQLSVHSGSYTEDGYTGGKRRKVKTDIIQTRGLRFRSDMNDWLTALHNAIQTDLWGKQTLYNPDQFILKVAQSGRQKLGLAIRERCGAMLSPIYPCDINISKLFFLGIYSLASMCCWPPSHTVTYIKQSWFVFLCTVMIVFFLFVWCDVRLLT